MGSNILSSIDGIWIYAVIGLILFIAVFVGWLYYVLKMDKNLIKKLEELPFDQNENQNQ